MIPSAKLEMLLSVFAGIILEAIPFILLGAIVSALIEVFIKRETVLKFMPKNKLLATFLAPFLGILFPVCECGIIVVGRRLLKKGMPLHVVIPYMLAGPIINPIVLLSTFFAFQYQKDVTIYRATLAYISAICIGYIFYFLNKTKDILNTNSTSCSHSHACNCNSTHKNKKNNFYRNYKQIIEVLFSDLFYISYFLIIGAAIAAFINTFVARDFLMSIGNEGLWGSLTMMFLAFILSICSEADAFIAASFTNFSLSSKLAFLVYGPMLDIKLIVLYLGFFKAKAALKFYLIISIVVFIIIQLFSVLIV